MSVPIVKTRLAEIQRTITGVKRAEADMPNAIPPSDLPFFGNFTGAATNDLVALGKQFDIENRVYIMRLYVAELGAGIPGEIERACAPFFSLVRDKFFSRPGLGLGTTGNEPLDGVMQTYMLGDSGASILQYAGEPFIGIEFRLQVLEYLPISYATYE